nr:calpain-1 catalytic subunit-like [Misgurnus anguillicaudatus]XP_055028267.1 calpain-1 catalytic subunit-like [Misgurnus anguillicaudatus]
MPRVSKKPRNARTTKEEIGSLPFPVKFLDQDYQELLQKCLLNKKNFVDEKFPLDRSSIDPWKTLEELNQGQIKWLRPSQIVKDPQLIVEGVSRFDYAQGDYLGNCWFLASVGALTFQTDILNQVMPAGQSFSKNYGGIFHFRFWQFGKWIDVVIDDQLPTINGKLIFVHSKTSNEFWPALLEKAYAKVCGSYADMHAGFVSEALMDFTGGVHLYLELKRPRTDLWELMDCATKAKALMGCGTPQGKTSANTVLPNGIVQGHAYTVTGVFKVTCQGKPVKLVRVLNPWGEGEWTGDWSDRSPLWDKVSEKDKSKCYSLANDGEFWMSVEDFTKSFEDLDICCPRPDFLSGTSKCSWTSTCYNGSWEAGTTAGGCIYNRDTFWTNPQFRVRIEELDEECAGGQYPENILVSLIQINEKRNRSLASERSIGFYVFAIPPELKDEIGNFPAKFFNQRKPVADTGIFVKVREVMSFFKLKPGEYIIIPSTYKPNENAKFILSVYSKIESHKRTGKRVMTDV